MNTKHFFIIILVFFLFLFVFLNRSVDVGVVSSDVWLYQYAMVQNNDNQPWSYIPPVYNQEKFYLAYPIFYYLNPGLSENMTSYFILAMLILFLIYTINGLVIKKIFSNWTLAALAGSLLLVPRYVFSTHIGMLNFRNFRGLSFAFPFYFLLSYYWLIYGIKNNFQNVALGILAGLLVYLYPPVGIMIIPIFILLSLIIHKKKYLKATVIFAVVYLLISSIFWYGHFSNPNSSMTDYGINLSVEQLSLQASILDYRIPDSSLRGIDFGTLKRSIWDGLPLFLLFIYSIYLLRKYKNSLSEEQIIFSKINFLFTIFLLFFILAVESINFYLHQKGIPPFFMEHLRLMRVIGFLWIAQAILTIYIVYNYVGRKFLAVIISFVLLLLPIYFFAPTLRSIVRIIVPENIRIKYNLAPVVLEEDNRDFLNLKDSALWSKNNINTEATKFLVFDDFQNEFKFKVLSRKDTNLTEKEGSIYTTASFEDSKKWFEERERYKEVTNSANNFFDIINLAKEFECTHILLPRGKFSELFDSPNFDISTVNILYSNADYKILELK